MAHILIIDDHRDIRSVLRLALEQEQHTVTEAPDGAIGLQRWGLEAPDLVLTDLHMPNKTGIEVIATIRHSDSQTPIILMSGDMDATTGRLLSKRWALDAVLVKPFDFAVLRKAVAQALLRAVATSVSPARAAS